MRKDYLAVGEVYHVYTKSIADFVIFPRDDHYIRMTELLSYYQHKLPELKFSYFSKLKDKEKVQGLPKENLVEIIAYSLMPTHVHLVLEQLTDKGVSTYMNNLLNSYSRYFNLKHNRKGPLWEGRFKNVLVRTDEQLLHLTRYLHLNPVTAYLVNDPLEWKWSSYSEYISGRREKGICSFKGRIDMAPFDYRRFVEDRIIYQRELAKIKSLCIEIPHNLHTTYAVE